MRIFFAILTGATSFITLQAFAYPNIGDKVTWSGEFQKVDGTSYKIQITKEVVAFNDKDKIWKVKVEAQLGDQKTADTFETKDLYSPQQYQNLISHCAEQGGHVEELKLNLGTFKTCRLTNTTPEGVLVEKWWGDMPFGVISKTTRDLRGLALQNPDIRTVLVGL